MIEEIKWPKQYKPSPQELQIIALCHANPSSNIDMLTELSDLPRKTVQKITKILRSNGNLSTAKNERGACAKGCYIATTKGRSYAGILDPAKVAQRTPSSHYIKLVPIKMVSHRPGAYDANEIDSRGLAC